MFRKTLILLCILILNKICAFTEIALPFQNTSLSGDEFTADQDLTALRVEHEKLILDFTKSENSFSRARYSIRNTGSEEISTDLLFVTPYIDKVNIFVNSKEIVFKQEKILLQELPCKSALLGVVQDFEMPVYRFHVLFPADSVTIIEIVFGLPAGYYNDTRFSNFYPVEAAHMLNWFIRDALLALYIYNLESTKTFTDGIRQLDVEILIPENSSLDVNIPLTEEKTENGITKFTGSFKGIPAPYIEATVERDGVCNMIGASLGMGMETNLTDYSDVMLQAMIDLYLYNHQISAGVEGEVLNPNLRIPIIYSFIPGEKTPPHIVLIHDIRFSAGALFDLYPEYDFGFRISASYRLTLVILEIAYDFYPFNTEQGYIHRMRFFFKVSI
ncbi:MAG: hypothetical protein JW822_10040 [Spirochaetales bacterium]|nr:hypothetical protein [Spirochaetales bacterium]